MGGQGGTSPPYGAVAAWLLVGLTALQVAACARATVRETTEPRPPQPTQTAVPASARLTSAELAGPGWRSAPEPPDAPAPQWPWALRQCILYDVAEYPAQEHRVAVRRQAYRGTGGRTVSVTVERFAAGWGRRSVDDVRRVIETCSRYEYSDRVVEFLDSHVVTAESFVADESLLVESTRIAPPGPTVVRYTSVVRRGDVVATVAGTGVPPAEITRLTGLLAARL